jgi:hypothetical protein
MSYNLTQLRILWEIASDGIVFNNYIGHSSLASGDFGPTNIKTDIIEQKWKTTEINDAFIIFDAGMTFDPVTTPSKGIVMDTIALLGTNLTTNAKVYVYGYGEAWEPPISASYVGADQTLLAKFQQQSRITIELKRSDDPYEPNVLWVSPTEEIRKFRHWCLHIQDAQNADGFIEVGRFAGGSASILTELENFTGDVTYSEESFKDELKINGFSSISNNRALKKKMTLTFDNLDINGQNYLILRRLLRYARDTKKMLVLPDPSDIYRFNLFAKLGQMPKYKIKYLDKQTCYATFDVEFDEGK